MEPVFKDITHIGIVVDDIEKTVKNYALKYGIGPWSVYDCGPENIKDMAVRGKNVSSRFRIADCRLGDTGLELIQPLDDKNIYSEFLKEKGQNLHHIGYEVQDYDNTVAFFKERGFKEYQRGDFYSKNRYIYFDSEQQLKHIIDFADPQQGFFKYHKNDNGISYLVEPRPGTFLPEDNATAGMIDPVFTRIGQVSFIVNSVDEMVRKYNDEFGIGPWKIWEFGPDTVNDMTIGGKPSDYRMRLALAKIGDIDVELIQPRDNKSIYADFLGSNGEGFHHLAYEVTDFAKLMKYMEKLGVKVSMSGNWCGRHIWVYLTTEEDLNHIVELNCTEPGFVYPDPLEYYPAG